MEYLLKAIIAISMQFFCYVIIMSVFYTGPQKKGYKIICLSFYKIK